jgi:hypothetical protein
MWQVVQQSGSDLIEFNAPKGGRHTLEIDDAYGFRTPVVKKDFSGLKLQLHALELGLIPGIEYHARLDGRPEVNDFRMELSTFTEPEVNCSNLRRTWEGAGRYAAGASHSRVQWNPVKGTWVLLENRPLIGQALYYAEYYLRPALQGARVCNDLGTFDEIAQYYLAVLQYTEPLGTLLSRPNVFAQTRERMVAADQSARTFPADVGGQVADGELYNVQWMHPAAELLRLISLLPPARRTPAMLNFAGQYTKFIVVDQLDRYLVQQRLPAPGGGQVAGRIEVWKRALAGRKGETPWATSFTDIDLWLVASAADVLGANANDPALAPLDAHQLEMLHRAVDTGVRLFESRRNDYPATKNFRGEQVGSVSYGNGDWAEHPDLDYSGVTSEEFPTPAEKRRLPSVGWDMAHAYRLPVFMRTLYENRKATGTDWPSYHEVQLFANQYVYRVFNGDYSRPLFHTHLDGSDGWHRVGYSGSQFGYPPSLYCNQQDPHRPCMTPNSIMGWGRLAFASPDLARIEQVLVKLAVERKPETQQFRDRYYFDGAPFEVSGAPGQQVYPEALYFLIGDDAEMMTGGSPERPH